MMDPSLALRDAMLALRLTDWYQDKRTSSIGNLPRKRRDTTEQMLKAVLNTKLSINQLTKLFGNTYSICNCDIELKIVWENVQFLQPDVQV